LCNLYSLTKGQQAIRAWAAVMNDRTGNLPPLPGIFADYAAPIVRNQAEGRELAMVRWGMPSPVSALKGKRTDPGLTNVRNVASSHWRRWLGVENRCVVPFTSFAGIWTPRWTSVRKLREGEVTTDLFAILTT
jgi:putative SOS response-associated peptidase YedK